MTERFVKSAGTISVANGSTTVTGTGTSFGGHDLEGAQLWVHPAAAAPYRVGTVAATADGTYDDLTFELVHAWQGTAIVDEAYELVDGPAIANGAIQAAIFARFAAFLEGGMGLTGNADDDPDLTLIPENSIIVDGTTWYQLRAGVLVEVFAALAKAGGTMSGALDLAPSTDVTAATETAIFAANTNVVRITGTTEIQGFDTAPSGAWRLVRFQDATPLKHDAGLNALPLGKDTTVTAGSVGLLLSLGSGNAVWLALTRKGGIVLSDFADQTAGKALYFDGTGAAALYDTSAAGRELVNGARGADIFKVLDADTTGSNSNSAQPWFPSAGGVTVAAATTYFFEGVLRLSRAAGSTSHTTAILFGGTATLTNIDWYGLAKTGDANDLQSWQGFWATAATALVLKAASTSTTEQSMFRVRGVVRINAGGTVIPQFVYSAAPGGAPTILRGSFFRLYPVGTNTVVSAGTWS